MAQQRRKPAKKAVAKSASAGGRQRKLSRGQKRQVSKKEASKKRLPNSFQLTATAVGVMRKHWRPLAGIILVYLVLNILFASGFSSITSNINTIKSNIQSSGSNWLSAFGGFGLLVGSAGASGSPSGSILQATLIILVSLVIIWSLRQLLAGYDISVKLAYYHSMAPLIPFLLVIAVFFIQLLPLTVGVPLLSLVFSALFNGGSLVTLVFAILSLLLAAWSVYMICGSIFAIYIVTLPDMLPRDALRAAKKLVRFRRGQVIRRLIFLPIVVLLVMGLILVPLIALVSFLAAALFFILSALAILFMHTYLYSLYRSLLE